METAPAIDGAALRMARERAGLSQNELARRASVAGGQRISRWERGEARPRSPRILHDVAAALGVTPHSLLLPPENGPNLRWLRYAVGLSRAELATAAHTSERTIRRWEADGLDGPSPRTVRILADVLVSSDDDVRRALSPRRATSGVAR